MKRTLGAGTVVVLVCALAWFAPFPAAFAAEFTSASFKVIDPVISVGGGHSTSPSFQLEQSAGQPAVGISTSLNFQLQGGFLFFPAPAAAAPAPAPAPALAGLIPPGLVSGIRLFFPAEIPAACPSGMLAADLDCDGVVGLKDLSIFLYFSGAPVPNRADFNHNAAVNVKDLSILFAGWNERLLTFVPESQLAALGPKRELASPSQQVAFMGEAPLPAIPSAEQVKEAARWLTRPVQFLIGALRGLQGLLEHAITFLSPFSR